MRFALIVMLMLQNVMASQGVAESINSSVCDQPSKLTDLQKQLIGRILGGDPNQAQVPGFQPAVGVDIPAGVAIYRMPSSVTEQLPELTACRYVKLQDQVLVINRSDRKIA